MITEWTRPRLGDVPAQTDTDRELIALADELGARIWGQFNGRLAELGLSLPEGKALRILDADETITMRTLAARLHANPSNVTVVVARLEARGLITRHSSADRRVKGVKLTPAGI